MTCPSCSSPLEPTARFCGVCGYRLAPNRPPAGAAASGLAVHERAPRPNADPAPRAANGPASPPVHAPPGPQPVVPPAKIAASSASAGAARSLDSPGLASPLGPLSPANKPVLGSSPQVPLSVQAARAPAKPRGKSGDEIYINQVLNNRFKVESKIGEGGFGAVYRGVQLATGRKVALKLLHPEMTKDENLVARFRREGMVLCNLRDAHTITTYDFDQTPDGTLYIAMELLEGKSLHQIFHEEAPLDWKRVFKILTEMCSSLSEAHAQGIVHRDLKPENIYLESRPGNPEFVKILDFGIAKVMRGDTIDPQSPQLTATGQTLGTLEYMSPEQLMGKPLDGRSDVYALGVLAYEMITGRLPFPDAKGPAGLITAQLKQTPAPPSQAHPKATLPKAADRAILRCLEKDKNNRFPDVNALATALQDAVAAQSSELAALKQMPVPLGANHGSAPTELSPDMRDLRDLREPRRGEPPGMSPALPMAAPAPAAAPAMTAERYSGLAPMSTPFTTPSPAAAHTPAPPVMTPPGGSPLFAPRPMTPTPPPPAYHPPGPPGGSLLHGGTPTPMPPSSMGSYPQVAHYPPMQRSSRALVWWILGLLALGAGVGTALALLFGQ
jgi:eukaryotic-like serine/threonine-protein kinase